MRFAIKAAVTDPRAKTFAFRAQKTMYGGKGIAKGDTVFVFASENEGGSGLIARGVVTSAKAIAKTSGIARQTPRVSITIGRMALARRSLGRRELKCSALVRHADTLCSTPGRLCGAAGIARARVEPCGYRPHHAHARVRNPCPSDPRKALPRGNDWHCAGRGPHLPRTSDRGLSTRVALPRLWRRLSCRCHLAGRSAAAMGRCAVRDRARTLVSTVYARAPHHRWVLHRSRRPVAGHGSVASSRRCPAKSLEHERLHCAPPPRVTPPSDR